MKQCVNAYDGMKMHGSSKESVRKNPLIVSPITSLVDEIEILLVQSNEKSGNL
jgi:hypothetical protein